MKLSPELEAACLRLATNLPKVEAPPPPFESEEAFQAWVMKYAKDRGWKYYHTYNSRRSVKGFPDLVLVRRGVLIFVELKFAAGKASAEQREWLDELKRVNGVGVYLWYESDVEEIKRSLM